MKKIFGHNKGYQRMKGVEAFFSLFLMNFCKKFTFFTFQFFSQNVCIFLFAKQIGAKFREIIELHFLQVNTKQKSAIFVCEIHVNGNS